MPKNNQCSSQSLDHTVPSSALRDMTTSHFMFNQVPRNWLVSKILYLSSSITSLMHMSSKETRQIIKWVLTIELITLPATSIDIQMIPWLTWCSIPNADKPSMIEWTQSCLWELVLSILQQHSPTLWPLPIQHTSLDTEDWINSKLLQLVLHITMLSTLSIVFFTKQLLIKKLSLNPKN